MDTLTKLYSESALNIILDKEIEKAAQAGGRFSLVYITPEIPEEYYRDTNYLILKQLANFVKINIRSADLAARSGEGIVILLVGADASAALSSAKKLKDIFDAHTFVHMELKEQFSAVLKYRIALFPQHGKDKTSLVTFLKNKAALMPSSADEICG